MSGECGEGVFLCAGVTSCSDWFVCSGENSNLLLVCLEVIIMGGNYNKVDIIVIRWTADVVQSCHLLSSLSSPTAPAVTFLSVICAKAARRACVCHFCVTHRNTVFPDIFGVPFC